MNFSASLLKEFNKNEKGGASGILNYLNLIYT